MLANFYVCRSYSGKTSSVCLFASSIRNKIQCSFLNGLNKHLQNCTRKQTNKQKTAFKLFIESFYSLDFTNWPGMFCEGLKFFLEILNLSNSSQKSPKNQISQIFSLFQIWILFLNVFVMKNFCPGWKIINIENTEITESFFLNLSDLAV